MPWSVTQRSTVGVVRAGRHDDAAVVGGVGHRVGDQVAQGEGDLVGVAEHLGAAGAVLDHLDVAGVGVDLALVDGPGDDRVDVDRLRVVEGVVALEPRQLDDLLHQPGEPGALGLHPPREPGDRLGVVGGVLDGLGQQVEGADGRLELVGHVGDEVATDRLDAALAGAVLHEGEHQPARQRRDAGVHVHRRPALPAVHDQLRLADLPVAAYLPDEVGQRGDGEGVAADQPHDVGGRRGLDHAVLLVDDEGAGAEHAEHGGDARGDRGLGERRHGVQLPLGEAPGEHDAGAEHGTEQGEERRLRRGVHSVDRTHPDAGCSPS